MKLIFKANKKFIDLSNVAHLLTNGEKNVDKITFSIDRFYNEIDLADCDFMLRAVNENKNLIEQNLQKTVSETGILLTWIIDEYFTAVDGELKIEIRGIFNDELIIKYSVTSIYVKSSATGQGLPQPNVVEKAIDEMNKILSEVKEISIKTPIIQNGTWWTFDDKTKIYIDTNITAKGEKGDTGADGQAGINGTNGLDGKDGLNGIDGLSAYQIWINSGNLGTEADFLNSLKGEKGDTGADGQAGINGANGLDGFSPTITVLENTDMSYRLRITDKSSTIETPNLKGMPLFMTITQAEYDALESPKSDTIYTVIYPNGGVLQYLNGDCINTGTFVVKPSIDTANNIATIDMALGYGNLVIPSQICGYPVTTISQLCKPIVNTASYDSSLSTTQTDSSILDSVYLDSIAINKLNAYAFKNALKVTFKQGTKLKNVGKYAFKTRTIVENLEFDENAVVDGYACMGIVITDNSHLERVSYVGDSSFRGSTLPEDATINATFLSGYGGNFESCNGVKNLITTNAYRDTFKNCSTLENAVIENGVGDGSFRGCTNLKTVTVKSGNIGGISFSECTSLSQINLEEGVTSLNSNGVSGYTGGCFKNCTSLISITIPKSVTSIYENGTSYPPAFTGCNNLTSVTVKRTTGKTLSGAPWGATNATVIWKYED